MSRKDLLVALLDQPQYQSLYVNNVGFHQAVDSILSMLPTWLAGLASQSLSDEAKRVEALQKIMDEPANLLNLDEMRFVPEAMQFVPESDVEVIESALTELVVATEPEESAREIAAIFDQGEKGVTAEPKPRKPRTPKKVPYYPPVAKKAAVKRKPAVKKAAVKKTSRKR
jgi:hypothetical protein